MAHNNEHETIRDVRVNAERDEEIDNVTTPADTNLNPAVTEAMEVPDYARGQREGDLVGRPSDEFGDFARGMDEPMDEDRTEEPDYARGQREDERSSYIPGNGVTGSEEEEGPDFARGQRAVDQDIAE